MRAKSEESWSGDSEAREKTQMEGEEEIESLIIIIMRVIQRFLSHRFTLDVRLWPDLALCKLFQSSVITTKKGCERILQDLKLASLWILCNTI